jgi:hypothetical protein
MAHATAADVNIIPATRVAVRMRLTPEHDGIDEMIEK